MLTKEILYAYLPYDVRIASPKMKSGERSIMDLRSRHLNDNGTLGDSLYKPLLRPLSSLTKPITHNGETFVFTELFEIGDDGGFIYDFGNGNTKLINDLESIAKYNSYHDINYLPHPVVKLMYQYHFDVHGLLSDGHAIELKEVDNG